MISTKYVIAAGMMFAAIPAFAQTGTVNTATKPAASDAGKMSAGGGAKTGEMTGRSDSMPASSGAMSTSAPNSKGESNGTSTPAGPANAQ